MADYTAQLQSDYQEQGGLASGLYLSLDPTPNNHQQNSVEKFLHAGV